MQMQLYVYRYSLDVVAMSYELYFLFGMQSLAGRGRRDRRDRARFFEGRRVFSVDTSSVFPLFLFSLPLYFFSRFRPTGKATINESIKAFSSYYSLRFFRSSILSIVDKKRKERQIVRKIVSLFADMPAGESEEWPSRDGH